MSRVGKNPIGLPEGVEVKINKGTVEVTGPKGNLSGKVNPDIKLEIKDGELTVSRPNDSKYYNSLHGLYRSLLNNMVEGVTNGFEKKLEIVGVGYRAEAAGKSLRLSLGFSHPIVYGPIDGVNLKAESPTLVSVSGVDKERVGQAAAEIRALRPPEPYKGKGIRYQGEHVRRKAGKTAI